MTGIERGLVRQAVDPSPDRLLQLVHRPTRQVRSTDTARKNSITHKRCAGVSQYKHDISGAMPRYVSHLDERSQSVQFIALPDPLINDNALQS